MALQAAQKAWELRQAAHAAGGPNAREEILAKAINKEIEAESFGKAAKYTQSGAFQGLAAGAGLGVQPGVTIGTLAGALVGGVVSTVTGLLGGDIGSVYGAMHGPFWDLGEMASQGVRGVVGDFPNWKSTPAQKRALEKMVMQTKETQAPSKEELEQMSKHAPDDMPNTWSQSTKDIASWRPSMPNLPSMPTGAALGLSGLGASLPSWGSEVPKDTDQAPQASSRARSTYHRSSQAHPSTQTPKKSSVPKEAPVPSEATRITKISNATATEAKKSSKLPTRSKAQAAAPQAKLASSGKSTNTITTPSNPVASNGKTGSTIEPPTTSQSKTSAPHEPEKKRPRKLRPKSGNAPSDNAAISKKAPRKLASRSSAT